MSIYHQKKKNGSHHYVVYYRGVMSVKFDTALSGYFGNGNREIKYFT